MMYKLLVNAPTGKQEIVSVTESGYYFDQSLVLWDERVDGEMPAITPGKMQRVNDQLIEAEVMLPAHVEAVHADSIPQQVLMPAARIAMLRVGVLDDVDAFVATLGAEAVIWWQTSVYIRRDFPLVEVVRAAMQWTNDYVDDLFIAARNIEIANT